MLGACVGASASGVWVEGFKFSIGIRVEGRDNIGFIGIMSTSA